MTCLASCFNKTAALSAAILLALSGCAAARKAEAPVRSGRVAVMPIENLSGSPAPLKEIRQAFIEKLKARGVAVLDDDALDGFMARHRVRFTGGIDKETASLFKEEAGVQGVVITSLEFYDTSAPPKISIISRLVAAGQEPEIKWMDSIGSSGDDHRGLLDIGLISDAGKLMDNSLERLSDSLAASLAGSAPAEGGGRRRFRPKYYYKSPEFDMGQRYRVVVAPFFNRSGRRGAEEIMMLQFILHLYKIPGMEVVEPGVVRDDLLRLRIVMDEGMTLENAEVVMITLDANLLFMGRVFDYQDYQGASGTPKVDFTVQAIERRSTHTIWSSQKETMRVVWSSKSQNKGDEGVFFFDRGKVNTADEMASEMVGNVIKIMGEK